MVSRKDKLTNRIVNSGNARLEKLLDIRSIVNLSRIVDTLLRLNYSRTARRLISMQRRHTVLEHPSKHFSSSD